MVVMQGGHISTRGEQPSLRYHQLPYGGQGLICQALNDLCLPLKCAHVSDVAYLSPQGIEEYCIAYKC